MRTATPRKTGSSCLPELQKLSFEEWVDVMTVVAQFLAVQKACREYGNVTIDKAVRIAASQTDAAVVLTE